MTSRSLNMALRRLSVALCTVSMTVQPLAAEESYYFRNVVPKTGPGAVNGQPQPTQNQVQGTGALPVFAASGARARPGVAFAFSPIVQNATGTVQWSNVGGSLPAGLRVSTSTGAITGSPTNASAGSYPDLLLQATDSAGKSGTTQPITLSVVPRPTVDVPSVTSVVAGAQVAIAPTAQDVVGSQSWSLQGTLPSGLSLNAASGRISGSTIQAGTVSGLVLRVTDSDGASGASAPFSIEVASDIRIGGLGANYGARLNKPIPGIQPSLSGATGQVTWSLASGTLPPGLSLGLGTGAITGTATQAGTYPGLSLQARDAASGATVASGQFSITVANAPTIALSPLSYFARSGSSVSIQPVATGLVGSPRFILDGGSLPAGLTLNTSTGAISGTPTVSSQQTSLVLRVVDLHDGTGASTSPFSLATQAALALANSASTVAGVGDPITLSPPRASNLGGTPTWAIVGTLPDGLSFDPATGIVSGTPKVATTAPVSLQYRVTDSLDGASLTGNAFQVTVLAPGALTIAGLATDYVAYTGQAFALTPRVLGASPPVTWSVSSLPMWAGFDTGTGAITGTPGAAEPTLTVRFTAQDASNKSVTSSPITLATTQALSVAYGPGSVQQGQTFSLAPTVTGASGAVSYTLRSGNLPDGLTLDASTGRITGTTFVAGSYPLGVSAKDSAVTTDSNAFVVNVTASGYSASIPSNPAGQPGQPFSTSATANGFSGAVTWRTVGGTLPSWATLGATTGTITGSPPAPSYEGPFVLEASDASGNRARTGAFSIVVSQTPVLTAAVGNATTVVGAVFNLAARATNTQGSVNWTLSGGTLPSGLSLTAATGTISGTPASTGTSSGLVLVATDASGATASTSPFSIVVNPASPLTVSLGSSSFSASLRQVFATARPVVGNAMSGYSVSLAGGSLPGWATLDAMSGVISGMPTDVSSVGTTADLRILVTDGQGRSVTSEPFSIKVGRAALSANGAVGFALHPGVAYSGPAPQSANAIGTVAWSVSPALPTGLSVNSATGAVSGTLASSATPGVTTYALVATDSADGTLAQAGSFQVTVLGTPVVSPPSPAALRFNVNGSLTSTASNVAPPLRWSLAAGTLPSGLTLDPATGAIHGAPGAVGTTTGLQIAVVDAQNATGTSAPFSISVGNSLSFDYPAYGGGPLPPQRVTVGWTSPAPIARSPIGAVSYVLSSGGLPAGLTLDGTTGVISGTASAPYTGTVILKGTDGSGESALTPALDVSMGPAPTVAIDDLVVRVGAPVRVAPAIGNARANPNNGIYGLSLSGGTLPTGLALGFIGQGTTWFLTGTPTAVASAPGLVLKVTDFDGAVGSSVPFSVTVLPGITVTGLQPSYSGRAGVALSTPVQPSVTNAKGGITWNISNVPAGLTFDSTSGRLSGTPDGAFNGSLALTATDAFDGAVASATVNLAITPALQVLNVVDLSTHVGVDASTLAPPVAGQKGPSLAWTSIGTTLPGFATLNAGTGVVTLRNPTLGTTSGHKLQAQDSADQATGVSALFALRVLPLPTVSNAATSYTARLGFPFQTSSPTLNNAIGGTTWSLGSGNLPGWAKLNADGSISGTPTAQGDLGNTPGLTVVGTDATMTSASSPVFSVGVYGQPAITLASTSATGKLRVGDSYTLTPSATGVAGTPDWSIEYSAGTSLPQGLALSDRLTGVVSGTVTGAGNSTFTLKLTDQGDSASTSSSSVTLAANPALAMSAVPNYTVHANQTYITTPTPAPVGLVGVATYRISPSDVPAGMNPFNASTGVLSGLPSVASGPTTYTQTVTDAWDGRTASTAFTVTVVDTLAFSTQPTDVLVTTGRTASMTPVIQNALGTVSYALQRNGTDAPNAISACTGLGFSTTTGAISGTTSVPCSVDKLSIVATDSTQTATSNTFTVAIAAADVTLASNAITVQEGSFGTLQASSNLDAPTWSLSGAPAGSSISQDGLVTVYGNDVADDQSPITTVSVTATSGPYSKARTFSLTTQPAFVSVATPQQVRSGGTFTASVSSTMKAPGTWTAPSTASDVTGVTFNTPNQASATMSGTAPAVSSVSTRSIKALYAATGAPSGAAVGAALNSAVLTIQPRLSVTATSVTGTVGSPVSTSAPGIGGKIGTVSYALFNGTTELSGAALAGVCAGLSFSTATGQVVGTPTQVCSPASLTVKAHDDGNNIASLVDDATSGPISINVTAATASVTPSPSTVIEGAIASFQANSSLPTPTYAFDLTTITPPAWLGINTTTGAIAGNTPDVTADTNYAFAVKATSGSYSATSPATTLTVRPASVTVSGPASVRAGSSTTATVSNTFTSGAGYSFVAYKADGTTVATDITFSAVSNGVVTITPSAAAELGTRYVAAKATSTNVPSDGVSATATASSTKVAFSVLAPLTVSLGNQNPASGSKATIKPTVTGVTGTPTYALLAGGVVKADALSSCGYVLNTATGDITTSGATACNVNGLAIQVQDGTGSVVASAPTFSFIVSTTSVPLAVSTPPNSPGNGSIAQSYPPMTTSATLYGSKTTYQAFFDNDESTYAAIGNSRAARVAYFFNTAGVQTDCMVMKGVSGTYNPVGVVSTFFLGNTQVGQISGTVVAGKYTQAVASAVISQADSMEIYTTAGSVGLSEWRLGNMSGGVCMQAGAGGPAAGNFSYTANPQSLSVKAGSTPATTVATLSGTPSGSVTWSLADSTGATAPSWLTTTGCTNSQCTVTAAPGMGVNTGTSPSTGSYFLTATDASGALVRSTGFTVNVLVPLAAETRPNSPGNGTGGASSAQSYPPMTATASLVGGSSVSMFFDDSTGTYANLTTSNRIAYFYDVAGVQTDCMVVKGATNGSGTGTINATLYLGAGSVGTASGSVTAGAYSQIVMGTPVARADSLAVVAGSGTLSLAEFRLGNMSNGICVQPGTGAPSTSLAFSTQPGAVTVAAGASATASAALTGTPSGTLSWSVVDSTGAVAPSWIAPAASCGTGANASCTVNVAPTSSTSGGTYAFNLVAKESGSGILTKSSAFNVNVTVSASVGRPTTIYASKGGAASCVENKTDCTSIVVDNLWGTSGAYVINLSTASGSPYTIEFDYPNNVNIGSMSFTHSTDCKSGTCSSVLQSWNGSAWVNVPNSNGYWTGTTTPSMRAVGSTYGDGTIPSSRWRYVFVQSSGGSIAFQRFRLGDKNQGYAP